VNLLEQAIVPVMILLVILALFAIARIMARNYIKVPPNRVLVLYGRRYKWPDGTVRGFKLITGGAAFRIPLLEQWEMLPTDAFQVKFQVTNVPSKEGVRVTVAAVASLKIGTEISMLEAAVNRFLSRKNLAEIEQFAQEIMEGGLRGVVATLTVEQLVQERVQFGNRVQEGVSDDLQKLGLIIDNFLIQDVSDEGGYIDALGKKRTAEVQRDAEIGKAAAKRDEQIRVADALREADQKASAARQAGETAKAFAEQEISNAQRERDVIQAQNKALVSAQEAKILIAAEIAKQEKQKELNIAKVEAEKAEIEARINLQEKESERKDAELQASLIVQAEREREATVIRADAEKSAVTIRSEGNRQAAQQNADAEIIKAEREAQARKAQAAAAQSEMEAQAKGQQAQLEAAAAGEKAKLLAEAEGEKARLLAEAEGIKAKLLAEAEGVKEKAEAYRLLDEAGKFLLILQAMPEIIQKLGEAVREAGEGTLVPMAQAIGTGLSGIEEVRIIDMAGNGTDGKANDALSRFTAVAPNAIFNLIQKSSALGLLPILQQLAQKAGIDLKTILPEMSAALATEKHMSPPATAKEFFSGEGDGLTTQPKP
jgi:flotillin